VHLSKAGGPDVAVRQFIYPQAMLGRGLGRCRSHKIGMHLPQKRAAAGHCAKLRTREKRCPSEKVGSQFLSLRQDAPLQHSPQPVWTGKFPQFHRVLAEKLWTARSRKMALWAPFVLSVSKAVYCADLVRNSRRPCFRAR
jgi:hypothetical protein